MRKVSLTVQIVLWAVVLAMSVSAKPQEQKNGDSRPGTSPASEAEKKPRLVDATRVSTSEVAKSVAKTESSKSVAPKSGEKAGDAAVLEFKPTASAEGDAVTVHEDGTPKSALKKIHGNVYGATGAGSRETGGAVGTTSKSGKTSVYVGTDRSRTSPPR
ncbi:MAG TPA: hypothetical protein VFD30_11805 [Terriglobia bacterium]|nr:hypothetical protein [Terriglobia bacterium]